MMIPGSPQTLKMIHQSQTTLMKPSSSRSTVRRKWPSSNPKVFSFLSSLPSTVRSGTTATEEERESRGGGSASVQYHSCLQFTFQFSMLLYITSMSPNTVSYDSDSGVSVVLILTWASSVYKAGQQKASCIEKIPFLKQDKPTPVAGASRNQQLSGRRQVSKPVNICFQQEYQV